MTSNKNSDNYWQEKHLYSTLINCFPEIKNVTPTGCCSKILTDSVRKVEIEARPFEATFATTIFNIDKGVFAKKLSSKSSSDSPKTSIHQVRDKINLTISNLSRHLLFPLFGSYVEGKEKGLLKEGDVKIEINDIIESRWYGILVNNEKQYARVLYKACKALTKREYYFDKPMVFYPTSITEVNNFLSSSITIFPFQNPRLSLFPYWHL